MSLGELLRPENRMEQLLQMWENKMQLVEGVIAMEAEFDGKPEARESLSGSLVNWRNIRKALLSRKPLDKKAFSITDYALGKFFDSSAVYTYVPEIMSLWSRTSRRIYCPTPDMQRSLELTSLGKVSWNDIHPPFPSFGLVLPLPISWQHGEAVRPDIDFIYVQFEANKVLIMTLGKDFDTRLYLPEKRSAAMSQALKAGDLTGLARMSAELSVRYYGTPAIHFMIMGKDSLEPIADELDEEIMTLVTEDGKQSKKEEVMPDYWKLIVRIVAGLCLHLETSSKERVTAPRVKTSKWAGLAPLMRGAKMVTAESQVCSIDTVRPLSPVEREMHGLLRNAGSKAVSMSVHFRSAHWRKKAGTAKDPKAPKCVHVDWAIVNEHHLNGESGLPMGSLVAVNA